MSNFRQALKYIWPYRRRIVTGVISAIGVSLLFTTSVAMLIPILQVITSREGLSGWVHRADVEHRLGVSMPRRTIRPRMRKTPSARSL